MTVDIVLSTLSQENVKKETRDEDKPALRALIKLKFVKIKPWKAVREISHNGAPNIFLAAVRETKLLFIL